MTLLFAGLFHQSLSHPSLSSMSLVFVILVCSSQSGLLATGGANNTTVGFIDNIKTSQSTSRPHSPLSHLGNTGNTTSALTTEGRIDSEPAASETITSTQPISSSDAETGTIRKTKNSDDDTTSYPKERTSEAAITQTKTEIFSTISDIRGGTVDTVDRTTQSPLSPSLQHVETDIISTHQTPSKALESPQHKGITHDKSSEPPQDEEEGGSSVHETTIDASTAFEDIPRESLPNDSPRASDDNTNTSADKRQELSVTTTSDRDSRGVNITGTNFKQTKSSEIDISTEDTIDSKSITERWNISLFHIYKNNWSVGNEMITQESSLNKEGTQKKIAGEINQESGNNGGNAMSPTPIQQSNFLTSETNSLPSFQTGTGTPSGDSQTALTTTTLQTKANSGSNTSSESAEIVTDNQSYDFSLIGNFTNDNTDTMLHSRDQDSDFIQELSSTSPVSTDSQSASSPRPTAKPTYPPTSMVTGSTPPSTNITYEDFVGLTTQNMTDCFQTDDTLIIYAMSGEMSFFQQSTNGTKQKSCTLIFEVPQGLYFDMSISINISNCEDFSMSVKDDGKSLYHYARHYTCYSEGDRITNRHNRIRIQTTISPADSLHVFLNFSAVPPPQLEIVYTSTSTGYVQTPGWDSKRRYPENMDSLVTLHVPVNSSVMVSFAAIDIEPGPKKDNCEYDALFMDITSEDGARNESEGIVLCNDESTFRPFVFHTRALLFHFVADGSVQHTGFRLLFSFHPQLSVPARTLDGKWNCSVPFWPQFKAHLACNLVQECHAGEDENNCTDLNGDCGFGLMSVNTRCYSFVVKDRRITWNEAANECLHREAYLASLNDPQEWNDVISTVRTLTKNTFYLGLHKSNSNFPNLYRNSFQWTDGSAVVFVKIQNSYGSRSADCAYLPQESAWSDTEVLNLDGCDKNVTDTFICEIGSQNVEQSSEKDRVHLRSQDWTRNGSFVVCPAGHSTWTFLACDVDAACWVLQEDSSIPVCEAPVNPLPPAMACQNGVERVPYSLVCDHRPDCSDNSDENFCEFPSCRLAGKLQCSNKQCVDYGERCDGKEQCLDGSDEKLCPLLYYWGWHNLVTPAPPVIVTFDDYGSLEVTAIVDSANETSSGRPCPETHFACPGNLTYCMPVFVLCNGVYDCPGGEDELGCDHYWCRGFYRCRASPVCLHADHVCDGVFHCPQHDDELHCSLDCPANCSCLGLAFYCNGSFPADQFPEIRFLDARGSRLKLEILKRNTMLIFLSFAECELNDVEKDTMVFPNLRVLDLSKNHLTSIGATLLNRMKKLQQLSLSGNPLTSLFVTKFYPILSFSSLRTLDLSHILLPEFDINMSMFPGLWLLNLSGCGIERIIGEGFKPLKYLRYLNLQGCPMMDVPRGIFEHSNSLQRVWADNYKLCCPATLPIDFNLMNCHSPSDEISSCDALLRSDFYRVCLSLFATLALLGNLGSFVYRVFVNRVVNSLGFGVFVTHLCVSDFLMGVYLAIIGAADRAYQGTYLWNDIVWKKSVMCKVAGFLSLLSSEVSAFIICLITLDRFLVIRFPLSRLHFRKKSAHVTCLVCWLIGIVLAGIPLLPVTAQWEFYSQNGICIPLPVTRNDFAGHNYSFGVIVVFNFILFLLIAVGQVFIFWSVRTNSMATGNSTKKSNDLTVARRLITIALTDFLCWFPIGLLGLLASTGFPIPGEVNVAMGIIALPVNSAINPFLYTINMLMERRRRAREHRIKKLVMSTIANRCSETIVDQTDDNYTKSEALSLINTWLTGGLLSLDNLEKILSQERQNQKSKQNPPE